MSKAAKATTTETPPAFHKSHNVSIDKIYKIYQTVAKVFEPLLKTLSSKERQSLNTYKGPGYQQINDTLRAGCLAELTLQQLMNRLDTRYGKYDNDESSDDSDSDSSDNKAFHKKRPSPLRTLNMFMERYRKGTMKAIQGIDSIFLRAPRHREDIKYPTLYRGVHSKAELSTWKIGAEIEMKDYLSASFSPSVAWNFQSCGNSPCCLIVMTLSKGMPGILLPWNTEDVQGDSITDENEILLPRNTRWKVVKKYKTAMHPATAIHCSFSSLERSKTKPITVYEVKALPWKAPAPFELREGWKSFIRNTVIRFDAYGVEHEEPERPATTGRDRRRAAEPVDEDINEVQKL